MWLNSSIILLISPREKRGKANPARRPASAAYGARGKFGSRVTSYTQVGFFELHARPGKPWPSGSVIRKDKSANFFTRSDGSCHTYRHRNPLAASSKIQIAAKAQSP